MVDTPTYVESHDLKAEALEHCIFPLIQTDEVRRDGPRIYVRGEGVRLTDADGHEYLDMMSSHTRANSLGYGNKEIASAVANQLEQLHYVGTVNNFAPPTIQLAAKIADLTPAGLSKVLFVNDGSEAVEAAIKIAKQYHAVAGKPRATKIISRWNAYHGATMGAIGATDWLGTRHIAEPGIPGYSLIPGPSHYRNPFGMEEEAYFSFCAEYLERQIQHEGPDYVAAFIAEPVMQANGVQPATAEYFGRVREICDRYGVFLIIDEVITGFGRTGTWFASERFGIQPDIMTMAKALTAGYVPMGAVATKAEIIDARCRSSGTCTLLAGTPGQRLPPIRSSASKSEMASSKKGVSTGSTCWTRCVSTWICTQSLARCAGWACPIERHGRRLKTTRWRRWSGVCISTVSLRARSAQPSNLRPRSSRRKPISTRRFALRP
jgi:adenosylmethionine-8-amino-7-oxononanoate aminotransferase